MEIGNRWCVDKSRLLSQLRGDRFNGMELALPARLEHSLSPTKAALHLAIGLFVSEELTLGQAAEVARLSQSNFLKELALRKISIHYGPEELAEDLAAVSELAGQ